MNLWRSNMRVERLDDRIVPDTTGVTQPTDPTSTGTSPAVTTPTTTGTSSTSQTGTTTGSTSTTVTTTDPTGSTTTTTTTTPASTTPAARPYAVGSDAGNAPLVRVYDNTGTMKSEFIAYPRGNFRGGVRTAMADMNGDGVPDIITAPGPGGQPYVKVFDGISGQVLLGFNAYDANFRGGVWLAVGDVNGDGHPDIVTGAGDGGGAHVKVFDGAKLFPADGSDPPETPGPDANLIRQFFAYDAQYLVGARVAVADVDGDGKADIITGAGLNGGPHVRVFSGADGSVIREWFAFDTQFRGGVYVGAGDLNGDGKAEIVVGMGSNGIGQVKVYDGRNNHLLREFVPEPDKIRLSVRLGVFDFDQDGSNDLVTSTGDNIDVFDGHTFVRTGGLTPFDDGTYSGGVYFG